MKTFEFVAFDSSGKKKVGTINAWKLSEAKRKIQQKGFYLASIKIQDGSVGSGIAITREGSRGTSGSGVAIKRGGSDKQELSANINQQSHGKCQPVALAHRNCGIQGTSSQNQNPFSFFKELKRFFFSHGKVAV